MAGLESDTIGGFNSLIKKQKKQAGKCYVSTILFDNYSRVLYDREKLEAIRPMTEDDYYVGGCTALCDAIGGAIRHIKNIHKYARTEDVPEKTLFVITTDGMENSSRFYNIKKVKQMIERQQGRYGWEFIFLGANIDAAETAGSMGIDRSNAVDYCCDSSGSGVMYSAVCQAVSFARRGMRCADSTAWREELDEDFAERGGKR